MLNRTIIKIGAFVACSMINACFKKETALTQQKLNISQEKRQKGLAIITIVLGILLIVAGALFLVFFPSTISHTIFSGITIASGICIIALGISVLSRCFFQKIPSLTKKIELEKAVIKTITDTQHALEKEIQSIQELTSTLQTELASAQNTIDQLQSEIKNQQDLLYENTKKLTKTSEDSQEILLLKEKIAEKQTEVEDLKTSEKNEQDLLRSLSELKSGLNRKTNELQKASGLVEEEKNNLTTILNRQITLSEKLNKDNDILIKNIDKARARLELLENLPTLFKRRKHNFKIIKQIDDHKSKRDSLQKELTKLKKEKIVKSKETIEENSLETVSASVNTKKRLDNHKKLATQTEYDYLKNITKAQDLLLKINEKIADFETSGKERNDDYNKTQKEKELLEKLIDIDSEIPSPELTINVLDNLKMEEETLSQDLKDCILSIQMCDKLLTMNKEGSITNSILTKDQKEDIIAAKIAMDGLLSYENKLHSTTLSLKDKIRLLTTMIDQKEGMHKTTTVLQETSILLDDLLKELTVELKLVYKLEIQLDQLNTCISSLEEEILIEKTNVLDLREDLVEEPQEWISLESDIEDLKKQLENR